MTAKKPAKKAARTEARERALELARENANRQCDELESAAVRWAFVVRARLDALCTAIHSAACCADRSEQIVGVIDAAELHQMLACVERAEAHAANLLRPGVLDELPNVALYSRAATEAMRTMVANERNVEANN